MSNNTRECERCGGVMRVYDENKSKTRFKCDTCKKPVTNLNHKPTGFTKMRSFNELLITAKQEPVKGCGCKKCVVARGGKAR